MKHGDIDISDKNSSFKEPFCGGNMGCVGDKHLY